MRIALTVNGRPVAVETRTDEMLHAVLRRELGLLSVRETCGIGVCGSCTVLVDGELLSSCLVLAAEAAGSEVVTVEGLADDDPVKAAFGRAHAFQCGYCTAGMILTARQLLQETPDPAEAEIRLALAGNLCRCGCYVKIVEAVQSAAAAGTT
jgi:aerobic-type carbon monoxide dehydrogenase small subunit (CoxS/CutS family)